MECSITSVRLGQHGYGQYVTRIVFFCAGYTVLWTFKALFSINCILTGLCTNCRAAWWMDTTAVVFCCIELRCHHWVVVRLAGRNARKPERWKRLLLRITVTLISGVPRGVWGVQPSPPEIPKALQNRAKLNPIVKTVKNCWI